MWRKRETGDQSGPRTTDIQRLLDTSVYSDGCLDVYRSVMGDGFVTPGGLGATKVRGRRMRAKGYNKDVTMAIRLGSHQLALMM